MVNKRLNEISAELKSLLALPVKDGAMQPLSLKYGQALAESVLLLIAEIDALRESLKVRP